MQPRRILIVLTSLCAEGTPVLALSLLRQWKRAGFDVRVVTLCGKPDDMRAEFAEEDCLPASLGISDAKYGKFFELFYKSYKLCRHIRPDAIVCFPFGWHSFIGWGARLAGVKRIVTHAGNYPPPTGGDRRKMAAIIKIGKPLNPKVIACSEYVAAGVEEHFGVPKSQIQVVYNGIDTASFEVSRGASSNTLRMGMVARLEMHKDQPTLIRAAKLLIDSGVKVSLELVGEGSRRKEFEELIQSLDLQAYVTLLGMRRDIADLLRCWDLFVFSARPDEGLGIALVEAIAVGVPVIASDVGACREVISKVGDDLSALVRPSSPEAIADAVRSFKKNRQNWEDRADRARDIVRQHFSIETMAGRYLEAMGGPPV